MKWIEIERRDDGLRVVTLARAPVNALGRELVEELNEAFADLGQDGVARCLIVRSAGRHFCAGADLKERKTMSVDDVRAFVPRLAGACNALAAIPYPTIAAVRGAAAGGGCELALAADFRLVADDAKIGLRETALAIIPGAGGTQRLPRITGSAIAKRWIFAAELHDADHALRDGVADMVVAADRLDHEAEDFAAKIIANGPIAVRLAKKAIEGGEGMPLADALAFEWDCYREVLGTKDRVEALAAFAEKRPPEFRGE